MIFFVDRVVRNGLVGLRWLCCIVIYVYILVMKSISSIHECDKSCPLWLFLSFSSYSIEQVMISLKSQINQVICQFYISGVQWY